MSEWQPIETAPIKKPILITDGTIVTVTYLETWGDVVDMFGHGFSGYEWDYDFDVSDATHWQPLPDAPNTNEEETK